MAHQYTDKFLRVPAEYPGQQIAENFDPYLDGSYTPPVGDAVALYVVEPKLRSFFRIQHILEALSLALSPNSVSSLTIRQVLQGSQTLPALRAVFDRPVFTGQTTLGAIEGSYIAPVTLPFSYPIMLRALGVVKELVDLASSHNIPSMEGVASLGVVNLTATLGTVEAATTRPTLETESTIPTLETVFTLKV